MQFYKVRFTHEGDKHGRELRVFAKTPGDALIEALRVVKSLKGVREHTMDTVMKVEVQLD